MKSVRFSRLAALGVFIFAVVGLIWWLGGQDVAHETPRRTETPRSESADRVSSGHDHTASHVSKKPPSREVAQSAGGPKFEPAARRIGKSHSRAEIAKRTQLPTSEAIEVRFDIGLLKSHARSGKKFSIEVEPDIWIDVSGSSIHDENKFEHVFGTSSESPGDDVSLTTDGKEIVVGIIQSGPHSYQLVHSGHKTTYIVKIDKSKTPKEYEKDGALAPPVNRLKMSAAIGGSQTSSSQIVVDQDGLSSRRYRVLFFYSTLARDVNGGEGGVQAAIANQIAIANQTHERSSTGTSFGVAGFIHRPEITDGFQSGSFNSILSSLVTQHTDGQMESLISLYQFDLLHVYRAHFGTDACGIAYMGDALWNRPLLSTYYQAVSAHSCNYKYTVTHELGHQLGMDHNAGNTNASYPANPESGPRYNVAMSNASPAFRTVMAYGSGTINCGSDYYYSENPLDGYTTCPVLMNFSSPSTQHLGIPLGSDSMDGARKGREFSDAFFALPVITSIAGSVSSNDTEALSWFGQGQVTISVQNGTSLASRFREFALNSVSATTYGEFYRNGNLIERVRVPTGYYAIRFSATTTNIVAANGDLYQVRIGNRFGYHEARILVDVHTPMAIGTFSPANAPVLLDNQTAQFEVAFVTGNPAPTCSWSYQIGSSGNYVETGVTGLAFTYAPAPVTSTPFRFDRVRYTCTRNSAYSANESTFRDSGLVTIYPRPTFVTQPQSGNAGSNSSYTLFASVTGGNINSYQWFRDGVAIPGSNSSSHTASLPNLTGTYFVRVTSMGYSIDSNTAVVTRTFVPTVTLSANANPITEGQTLTLTGVVNAEPAATLSWLFNGATIVGQTSNVLTLSNIQKNQAGTYTLRAENSVGTRTAQVNVTVNYRPIIFVQPISSNVGTADTYTMSVLAMGSPNILTYQWLRDGVAINGATSASYTATQPNLVGSYVVRVTNSIGSTDSNAAVVSRSYAPVVTLVANTNPINEGQNLILTGTVDAEPAATLSWLYNGTVISGQTGLTLNLNNIQRNQSGTYTLRAQNTIDTRAAQVIVTVYFRPTISTQPLAATTVEKNGSITLNVVAQALPAPLYRWVHRRTDGSTAVVGNAASLAITPIDWIHRGTYICEVENLLGTTSSTQAEILVPAAVQEIAFPVDALPPGVNPGTIVRIDRTGGFTDEVAK